MKLNYEAIFELFPEAQIETDNDGQIIIYTGMEEGDSDAGLYFMDRDENNLPPAKWIDSISLQEIAFGAAASVLSLESTRTYANKV